MIVTQALLPSENTLQMKNAELILGTTWVDVGDVRHFVTGLANRFEELVAPSVAFGFAGLTMRVEQPDTSHPAGAPSGVLGSMRKIT